MKKDKNKINFFKKIYLSIFNIKKYDELSKEGFKKALYYIRDLIFIVAIIYGGISITLNIKNTNRFKAYLSENLPDFTYQDNLLNIETEDRIILDNNLIKANIGGRVIIDTISEQATLIDEYKKDNEVSFLLTKDKLIKLNAKGEAREYDYQNVFENYSYGKITNLNKENLLHMFDTIPYSYYFLVYIFSYCISMLIIVLIYDLIISLLAFCVCQIQKKQLKFKEIYTMGLYSLTLLIVVYTAISFIPLKIFVIVRIVLLIVSIIYLAYAIRMKTK